jgi:exopolyphosphatase/guanosine-5'-triphosphate,3'-diphosphate pyrophosphatase
LTQPETSSQVLPITNRSKQLGALDLGSNSFHLLIAQESHGRVQVLDKYKEMVRLAEGLRTGKSLDESVVARALECLERFGQLLRPLDVENVRIVGTNTLRKAKDSGFIAKAEQILGHKIDIISGREEARLIFMGVCHDLGGEDTSRLVVDIGGGSTELILGRKTSPERLESLYMGCVSMSQKYFADGVITKQAMQKAINHALVELEPVTHDFIEQGWESSVGASGTINAVREVITNLTGEDLISRAGLAEIRNKLISAGKLSDLNLAGLADERKAVFPGGVAILSAIFEALQIDTMMAAQSALREGLIYDLLGRQQEDDAREHTVNKLMQHYRIDIVHARQVRETALSLLSQVAMAWDLTESGHKLILGWAASLHEIGMDISHSGYHKHGGYLLENMDLPGFSRAEQKRLATLVRVHRRKVPTELFSDDTPAQTHLCVLLRIAAVLHRGRSHTPLPHVNLQVKNKRLTLSLPEEYLETHPLTAEDLDNEANYIKSLDVELMVSSH